MNRVYRVIFLSFAVILAVFAFQLAYFLHRSGRPIAPAETFWAALGGALFLALAAVRFSFKGNRRIFALLLGLALVEFFLQATAWLGLLPGVNTKEKLPYARVYWTGEGRGNSIRNRYGWHFPEFELDAPRRIVMIGDSFVEAVEVPRDRNNSARLQELLRQQNSDTAILALGTHGTGPAHHIAVLDYAQRHFAPQEAIVVIYLGNDLSDSSPRMTYSPPVNYIYYDFDPAGQLVLSPQNVGNRDRFLGSMELCHWPLWVTWPAILRSHCMLLQTAVSCRDSLARARRLKSLETAHPQLFEFGQLGVDSRQYEMPFSPDARQALNLLIAELGLMQQQCETNHIRLRLVTIPFIPPQFYSGQSGTNWTLHLGNYDFLVTDHEVADFAKTHDIPYLSFADWLQAQPTDVKEIQKLYFFNGSGHFTEQGHRLCAQAIYDTFYKTAKP